MMMLTTPMTPKARRSTSVSFLPPTVHVCLRSDVAESGPILSFQHLIQNLHGFVDLALFTQ